jgi:hypothetical protein
MQGILNALVLLALAAVTLVLVLGLWNMARGGNPRLSQKLMRWRVAMQFVAIIVVMAAIFVAGG